MTLETSTDDLTVEAIYDLRLDGKADPVHAETYLSTLSEAEWTDLRRTATRTGKSDNPLLRCGDCGEGVYARESTKGRRHCYHFGGDHRDCRWSGAVGRHTRAIDAEKFRGQQEGERHKHLSRLVAEVLALDPVAREAGIAFRRYTKLEDGQYGYPDIYAHSWQGAPAAFEIQLSTTQVPDIVRREDFYERGAIRLAWIVGYDGESLNRRAFRDIYMSNDGQVLGMDEEVAAAARQFHQPRFRLIRLLPGPAREGFVPHRKDRIVGSTEINWGAPGDRPRSAGLQYDAYLNELVERNKTLKMLREDFYAALSAEKEHRAGKIWDDVAKIVGGCSWSALPTPFDTARALGVLATIRTNQLCVRAKIPATNLPHLVNTMLLQPENRRCWTHAFELLCLARGFRDLMEWPKVLEKRIRNRREEPLHLPPDVAAGPVFNVFFPEGAFRRLAAEQLASRD